MSRLALRTRVGEVSGAFQRAAPNSRLASRMRLGKGLGSQDGGLLSIVCVWHHKRKWERCWEEGRDGVYAVSSPRSAKRWRMACVLRGRKVLVESTLCRVRFGDRKRSGGVHAASAPHASNIGGVNHRVPSRLTLHCRPGVSALDDTLRPCFPWRWLSSLIPPWVSCVCRRQSVVWLICVRGCARWCSLGCPHPCWPWQWLFHIGGPCTHSCGFRARGVLVWPEELLSPPK